MHPIDLQLNLILRGDFENAKRISDTLEAKGPYGIEDRAGNKSSEMWIRHTFNRAWFHLNEGRWQDGYQSLEAGRFINVYGDRKPLVKNNPPIWEKDQSLTEKRIVLVLEGGFGDEIVQVRFAKWFKDQGAFVIVCAHPSLHSLFSRIAEIDKLVDKNDLPSLEVDYWIPGFSSSWLCNKDYSTLSSVPYLTPNKESVNIWKALTNKGEIKIGIRWAGNPQYEHQQFRRFDLKYLLDLSKHKSVQLYSLQKDDNTVVLPETVIDLQHILISWEDTAAAIENLDLVITSCTSIAHLSAALGKETWVVSPILPYHTWTYNAPDSTTSPWYETVKLYRQKKFAEWNETFDVLYKDFEEKFKLPHIGNQAMKPEATPFISSTKTLHFISGLPESGGDIIAKILTDGTTNVQAQWNSGLYEIFAANLQNFKSIVPGANHSKQRNFLRTILENYHNESERPIIIDGNHNWINLIPLLEDLLGYTVKIICPVRNPAEILSVFEMHRKNDIMNANLDTGNSIAARCLHYAAPSGILGHCHAIHLDAVTQGLKDRLLFVDYNKLHDDPPREMKRICNFVNLEYQPIPVLKDRPPIVPTSIIGFDLFQQYNSQIFWQQWT